MTIKVVLFAQLTQWFGFSVRQIRVEKGLTAGAVLAEICREADRGNVQFPVLYAVNEEFAGPDTMLRDGDTLALLPPVSGG